MEIWWQIHAWWGWWLVTNLGPHKFSSIILMHTWGSIARSYPTIHWLYQTGSKNVKSECCECSPSVDTKCLHCHIMSHIPCSYTCAECSPHKGMPSFQSGVPSYTKGSVPRLLTRRINAISVVIFCYGLHRSMQDISSYCNTWWFPISANDEAVELYSCGRVSLHCLLFIQHVTMCHPHTSQWSTLLFVIFNVHLFVWHFKDVNSSSYCIQSKYGANRKWCLPNSGSAIFWHSSFQGNFVSWTSHDMSKCIAQHTLSPQQMHRNNPGTRLHTRICLLVLMWAKKQTLLRRGLAMQWKHVRKSLWTKLWPLERLNDFQVSRHSWFGDTVIGDELIDEKRKMAMRWPSHHLIFGVVQPSMENSRQQLFYSSRLH